MVEARAAGKGRAERLRNAVRTKRRPAFAIARGPRGYDTYAHALVPLVILKRPCYIWGQEAPMNKCIRRILAGTILFFSVSAAFAQSFQAGIGADFFRYENTFLDLRAAYLQPLKPAVELSLGGSFAILTEERDGTVEADFFIPLDGGVVFLFPVNESFAYQFGLGVTAQFLITSENRFYMGPYLGAGVRVRVHPYMVWFLEGRQDLVIGKPDWINTSSRISSGIIFSF